MWTLGPKVPFPERRRYTELAFVCAARTQIDIEYARCRHIQIVEHGYGVVGGHRQVVDVRELAMLDDQLTIAWVQRPESGHARVRFASCDGVRKVREIEFAFVDADVVDGVVEFSEQVGECAEHARTTNR